MKAIGRKQATHQAISGRQLFSRVGKGWLGLGQRRRPDVARNNGRHRLGNKPIFFKTKIPPTTKSWQQHGNQSSELSDIIHGNDNVFSTAKKKPSTMVRISAVSKDCAMQSSPDPHGAVTGQRIVNPQHGGPGAGHQLCVVCARFV
jgi:hypothetical protein